MDTKVHEAYLIATPLDGGDRIEIASHTPGSDRYTTIIRRGEIFGGHTFDEWAAMSKGLIPADWLDV